MISSPTRAPTGTPAADTAAARTGEGALAEGLQRARALGEQAVDEFDALSTAIEEQTQVRSWKREGITALSQGMLVSLGARSKPSAAKLSDTWPSMVMFESWSMPRLGVSAPKYAGENR